MVYVCLRRADGVSSVLYLGSRRYVVSGTKRKVKSSWTPMTIDKSLNSLDSVSVKASVTQECVRIGLHSMLASLHRYRSLE